jgi:hypothetical protein
LFDGMSRLPQHQPDVNAACFAVWLEYGHNLLYHLISS